ncbi:unnamed protein product [Paramecium sonneborni]|uniref:Transmembrane protein n=1 Tax=Paramecium sonneborni TaxID=65129 RepID=A0A8S1Q2S3_9CILI|nr:unnamed protein product [Paramecium sonneborni]
MMKINLIILALRFQLSTSYYFIQLEDDLSIYTVQFEINAYNYQTETQFSFAIWSRYSPLSNNNQVGQVGIFDSNCFHLHNVVEQSSQFINFLLYDCLDYSTKKIKRKVQFVTSDNQWHLIETIIDNYSYEYVWHFFGLTQWPIQKRLQLIFIQYPNIIEDKILELRFPYKDINLFLTFGGGLIIDDKQQIPYLEGVNKFSYFPGQILIYPFSISNSQNNVRDALRIISSKQYCDCYDYSFSQFIPEKDAFKQDSFSFSSEHQNCDSFSLQTWVRIIKIYPDQQEFQFQLIKLSASFDNQQLIDQNLAAFQLFYYLSAQQNQIIITTYSYTFPLVNIDFSENPFLISKKLDIMNDLKLWQYISVVLVENEIQASIIFYEGSQQYYYDFFETVQQFHLIQFRLEFGNIQKQTSNYLNTQFRRLNFESCPFMFGVFVDCHYSCEACDGPTQSDCLSCRENSNRIYIPEYKTCVCSFDQIDQIKCIGYESLNLIVYQENKKEFKCNYGYYQYEDQCIQCPSIINDKFITCLECLQNPIKWAVFPFCYTDLYQDQEIYTSKQINYAQQDFVYDGNNPQLIQEYNNNQNQNVNLIQDFEESNQGFKNFCYATESQNIPDALKKECYKCNIRNCEICLETLLKLECKKCEFQSKLVNEECQSVFNLGNEPIQFCSEPYYLDSQKECKLCSIEYCKYCFEYISNDLKKCTLYRESQLFDKNEYHKVGCAQCEEDFLFDFILGQCIFRKPSITNCLRSYISLDNKEICTLTATDDFNVAPESKQCEKFIKHCRQCILTPEKVIKCVLCDDGFTASITQSKCYLCSITYSKICIEGYFRLQDAWVQFIQSFLMQFLPNKYYYPPSKQSYQIQELVFKCQEGYMPNSINKCMKYCDSECQSCLLSNEPPYQFYCNQCSLNNYQQPILSYQDGNCLKCSQLCQVCRTRTFTDINQINGRFQIITENQIYTYKCIQKINYKGVVLDPYIGVPKYCFNYGCTDIFEYHFDMKCQNSQYIFDPMIQDFQDKIKYFNEFGIQKLILIGKFNVHQIEQCNDQDYSIIENELQYDVFSLQKVQLKIIGNHYQDNIANLDLEIINIDDIEIDQMQFYMGKNSQLVFSNFQVSINLIIKNTKFYSSLNVEQGFTITFYQGYCCFEVVLKNVTFVNLNLQNFTLFQNYSIHPNATVLIEDVTIENCIFTNYIFFSFPTLNNIIKIQNFHLSNTKLYNSSIFFIGESSFIKVQGENMTNYNNEFISSSFIVIQKKVQITLKQLLFSKCIFENSNTFILNLQSSISYIQVKDNKFINSKFIQIMQTTFNENLLIFDSMLFELNKIFKSILIESLSTNENNQTIIYLTNILINNISRLESDNSLISIFNFNCQVFKLINCSIYDSDSILFFNLFQVSSIEFQNITNQNQFIKQKLPYSPNCLNQINIYHQLVQIQGFDNIKLRKIKIINQFSIDNPILQIFSNVLYNQNIKETIDLEEFYFSGNILLKQSYGKIFSLISIYSEKKQQISFKNIQFNENFYHEQIHDPTSKSASLLFLDSQQSEMIFSQITCFQNGLTNSSNTYFYMNLDNIVISQISIKNHNFLDKQIWNKYYNIDIDIDINQDEVNYIVQKIFIIKNLGGVMQISAAKFNLVSGIFHYILSSNSQILEIRTQNLGIINLNELDISSIETTSNSESQGCINIYSRNSQLYLELRNARFLNIYNKLNSVLFGITPSLKQNLIKFENITMNNCISLLNQFMKIEFSYMNQRQNQIFFKNLIIIQNQDGWINYFQKINQISLFEIEKVNKDNAVLNLYGCQLIIEGLIVEGIFISPIIKIIDFQKVIFMNFYLDQISMFYPLNIFHFGQSEAINQSIHLQNIQIKNTTSFTQWINNNSFFQIFEFNFSEKQCKIKINDYYIQSKEQKFSIQEILNLLNLGIYSTGSLIFLSSISNQNIIVFNSIFIKGNNCQGCLQGLISFQINDFLKLRINDLICILNNISQYGCLHIQASNILKQKIKLYNSLFLKNNGTYGSAIFTKFASIEIQNVKFLKNQASDLGGAIYMQDCKNDFKILMSLICENRARQGGGIYFNGNNQIDKNNLINSLILLNYAESFTNNIVETPHSLFLSINNCEMQSYQFKVENTTINILKLNNYKTFEQGTVIYANQLMLPSNQQIKNYKLYNPKIQSFQSYINEISLNFQNSMNEKLYNVSNSSCQVYQNKNNESLYATESIQQVFFNKETNNFDLSQLSFTYDPYQNEQKKVQIKINCSTFQRQNYLQYLITGKTFKCQLGEFYVDSGCQMCQPNQGYYSVTYNTTKCSIFDKTKFQSITSNKIQLLQGFWRPNPLSDLTEQCFKNQEDCIGGWDVGNNLCFMGHIGGLCEECDIYNIRGNGRYFKVSQAQTCSLCMNLKESLLPFFFASFWSILQNLLTLRSIDQSNQLFLSLKLRQKFSKILFKLNQDHQSILIKMFINYLWIFSVIFTFNIQFSLSFGLVDQASNPSNFMATSLDCLVTEISVAQLIYSRIITILILVLIQLLIVIFGFFIYSIAVKQKFDKTIISNTSLYLYVSNYASIIKQTISLLAKRQISNIDYVQGNVSIEFDTQNHYTWIIWLVIPGFFVIGILIPLFLFTLMFILRKQLDQIRLRRHICYMFNEYNDQSYYWEFIKIWKKTIFIFILTYFETNIYLKGSLFGLCLLIYQAICVSKKPYIIQKLNNLDLLTGQICSISIFLAVIKYVSEQQENQIWSKLLQTIIMILCIKLCYPFIFDILQSYYNIYKISFLKLLFQFLNSFIPNQFLTKLIKKKIIYWENKQFELQFKFRKLKKYLFSISKSEQKERKKMLLIVSPQVELEKCKIKNQEKFDRFDSIKMN